MIEFAGQTLLLADTVVQRTLDHYDTLGDLYCSMDPAGMHFGNQPPPVAWWRAAAAAAPLHVRRARPPRWQLNSLWMPVGASRFGIGLFLIDAARIGAVLGNVDAKGGATLKLTDSRVVNGQEKTTTRSGTMYLLPPIGLFGECRSAYLLPVVDVRWFWQYRTVSATGSPSTWTWAQAQAAVDTALGGLGGITWGSVTGFERPDWFALGSKMGHAGMFADAVAASTGRRIMFSWEDGKGYADTATTALSEHQQRVTGQDFTESVIHGGETVIPNTTNYGKSIRPNTIVVLFDKRQGGYQEQRGNPWKETVSTSALTNNPVGTWQLDIHTTAQADMSSGGIGNSGAVNALALDIARDYLRWHDRAWDVWVAGLGPDAADVCAADDYWLTVLDKPSDVSPSEFSAYDADDPLADMLADDSEPTFFTRWKSMSPTDGYFAEQCQQFAGSPLSRMATGLNKVELTEDLAKGGSAKAYIYYYDEGGGGYVTDENAEVTVFDALECFEAKSGDRLWVCSLPHDSARFEAVAKCHDNAILAKATLTEELCKGSTQVGITQAVAFPDCTSLDIDTAYNPRAHSGPSGSEVVLAKLVCSGVEKWEIIDITLREACAVIKVEDRTTCLTQAMHKWGAEWSSEDEPQSVCLITPINPCASSGSGSGGSGGGGACDLTWGFTGWTCCGSFGSCSGGSG